MHALLVTRDDRVITEFQKIAAVTQTPLVIESEPNADDLSNAYRVFVASESLIKVELKLPNTYFPTRFLLPNLVASATAGIAQPIEPMP